MPNSRKRKSSVTIQGPVTKQPRNQTPIVISDDSDDDIRQISPPRLTAKQKGKGRAVPETDDPPRRLRDIDVISIPDDEAPILPAVSRHQTPLEVPDHQLDFVKETSAELGTSSEAFPPDQILEQCRDLFFGERKCSQCESKIQPIRNPAASTDLRDIAELLHIFCADCKINHCRGCMSPVLCASPCGQVDECDTVKCCARARVIAIFEILAILDFHHLKELSNSQKRISSTVTKARKGKSSAVGPGGTGYATDRVHSGGGFDVYSDDVDMDGQYGLDYDDWGDPEWGWGHDGFSPEPSSLSPWGTGWGALIDSESSYQAKSMTKTKRSEKAGRHSARAAKSKTKNDVTSDRTRSRDETSTWVLDALAVYLPDPYADSPAPFDFVPHPSIGALLQLSYLPETLGALLRNDSVADWIARSETYQTMLRVLRRLADCELTIRLLVSRGWSKAKSCGIDSFIRGDGEVIWERDEDGGIVRAAPLYNHFDKLTKQCEAYLTGMSSIAGDIGEIGIKEMSLCGDTIAAKEDLDRCLAVIGTISDLDENKVDEQTGKAPSNGEELDKAYERECEELAFKYVMLAEDGPTGGLVYRAFHYRGMVEASSNDTRIPKDRLHILKELAVMGTGLPPGIWVRVDEVRNDVIKIMIAGPENTPYAGGLFEFDCFLPMQYPNSPPLVNLCTTGGGRVRFNPNLYDCGKVCLSLLGTWSGSAEENWQPRKSTLLQVLVSIQSMILVEAPYFNEPGHGQANPKRRESIAYNRNICLQTVRWAIVEWLDDTQLTGLWGDVIRSHFSLKHEKVRGYIKAWANDNPSVLNYVVSSTRDGGVPCRRPRARRGEARTASAGMDLLAEYDHRIHKLLRSTSGSGETRYV
ncbi:hypothetical protein BDM02DRAFT_3196787 [Thelephora ganbajun]|uniref:Uncharacterized protein n=1 Tax=Thelephora ganbajun TaxID=370292 RepID=A0ACB6ZYD9_THEGA|nr:hypothetical protein BDM02DRAFT_3196787 [Thelephora ganbajun]